MYFQAALNFLSPNRLADLAACTSSSTQDPNENSKVGDKMKLVLKRPAPYHWMEAVINQMFLAFNQERI
jgi:hypothetical protein